MSNLIPPLLSSSPPPIVGPLVDEDDDDEFGDFRAANDSYDCDDFSLPPTPQKSPDKVIIENDQKPTVLDINSNNNEKPITNKTDSNEDIVIGDSNQKDFQDKRKINEDNVEVNSNNSLSNEDLSIFNGDCDDNIEENGPNIDDNDDLNIENCDNSENNKLELLESDKIGNNDNDFGDFETHFHKNDTSQSDNFTKSDSCNNSQTKSKIENISDDDDFNDFQTVKSNKAEENNSNGNCTNLQTIQYKMESNKLDDDSFTNFQTIESEIENSKSDNENFANFETLETKVDKNKIDDGNFTDFQTIQFEIKSNREYKNDDFGDFATPPTIEQTNNLTETINNDCNDDDFDDFSEFTSNQPVLLLDSNDVLNKCETIVKEIFPKTDEDIDDFRCIDDTKNDKLFCLLQDVTETDAINYQWSKSNSQKSLLKSLNIDMRNILYGPGWSSSMPRFASNLGQTPLEPVKTEILTPTPVQQMQSSPSFDSSQKEHINNVDIPNVQFDWNDSGLINPLDSAPLKKEEIIHNVKEPNENQQKPDLFLTNITEKIKTLTTPSTIIIEQYNNDNDDNKIKDLESPKMIPLRETYISNVNVNLEKPDWFQSTIQTPESPKKKVFLDNVDDDFDDFQMVLPESKKTTPTLIENVDLHIFDNLNKQLIEETITSKNNSNNNNNDDDDEFTDFHSSLPTVLQPVPLQPLKPSIINPISFTQTNINWPEPGVSDEDIRNIELSYSLNKIDDNKNNLLTLENDNELFKLPSQQQQQQGIDDEWSDFVSVIPIPKVVTTPTERTATPDLPLSVLNLNYIQPAKPPIPVITPNGLVQTKLSTNLNSAPKSTNIIQTKISTNYQQPTLITNQFNNMQNVNFNLITTPIKPITQIDYNNKNNGGDDDDDDDWSDFVSSQPTANGYQMKMNQNKTNITTNPNFDTFRNYTNPIRKNSFINGQQNNNIATIPDLDFIAPKSRTNNKK